MLTQVQFKRRRKTSSLGRKMQLAREIKNSPGWRDDTSLSEVATLLNKQEPFTYLLSEGMDECHFFLSFVGSDHLVRHKSIRIVLERGEWRVKNGASISYEAVAPLIPNCLRCSNEVCKPLV